MTFANESGPDSIAYKKKKRPGFYKIDIWYLKSLVNSAGHV